MQSSSFASIDPTTATSPLPIACSRTFRMPADVVAPCQRCDTAALHARIRGFRKRFEHLDFDPIVTRALGADASASGYGAIAASCYRDFLCLLDLYPELLLSPTPLLDAIWHAHILDTRRYRQDCHILFGQFLDHQPWDASHEALNGTSSAQMRWLFRYHFNRDPEIAVADRSAFATGPGACGRGVA